VRKSYLLISPNSSVDAAKSVDMIIFLVGYLNRGWKVSA